MLVCEHATQSESVRLSAGGALIAVKGGPCREAAAVGCKSAAYWRRFIEWRCTLLVSCTPTVNVMEQR